MSKASYIRCLAAITVTGLSLVFTASPNAAPVSSNALQEKGEAGD